ncbi:hypothetical protein HZA97_08550 [Candidatus Woesearchaeota archaeon]|nr:hypothetical protein [Candidatus Woesearchaeota archaeon]
MCYRPDEVPNKALEEKLRTHTERIKRAEKLKAGEVEFPVIRNPSTPGIVKIFMFSCHDVGNESYCRTKYYKGKTIRLIDFTSDIDGVIYVAGYLKGYKPLSSTQYDITDDRWETIQLLSEEEKAGLEELLKKTYATVNFWK